ncbi:BREX-2 system phosphatase PglZ [Planomonospora sp. ID91781]|uniref:BREX-2 system phosphatase PglZ n=1 Tax=Planomonospora sp. ID91781 TaxID=2738135 RepID=UPI0018C4372F|nr:BREX-2 system phosphatase PglZ [Planomonospora sp. ID91781]MBG0825175.1 BREX-2 system phosphatase PglZ [Planomonospora sp. ID91781]
MTAPATSAHHPRPSSGSSLTAATLPLIRTIVNGLQESGHRRGVVGIQARLEWTAERELTVNGTAVRVEVCPSPLAVREAMLRHGDGYLVVVTDLDDADLGIGIRAHLLRGRLLTLRPWDMLKQSFQARDIDPLLLDEGWAAGALTRWEPAEGWPKAPGGTLTRDHALGHLASAVLGASRDGDRHLSPDHPDALGLLRWSLDPVAVHRLTSLPDDVREGLTGWLSGVTGAAGTWTLRAAEAGHSGDAVPLALVAGLLWRDGARDAAEARGLLRARVGGADLPAEQAQAWSRAAEALVGQLDRPDSLLERAEALLREFNAEGLLVDSTLLPGSYELRLRAFATELRRCLPARDTAVPDTAPDTVLNTALNTVPDAAALAAAEAAHGRVAAHELAGFNARTDAARMALRLLRWLAVPGGEAATLADALHEQVRTGAYVEWAFRGVRDPDDAVAAAYRDLLAAVAARRGEHDRRLAGHLAAVIAADSDPGTLVPIESALATLVRPLGRSLLVVVDGMSAGVLAELAESLAARRWTELVDSSLGHRRVLLPALPTVTEACRTSLLTGTLHTGGQYDEKTAFPGAVGDAQARLFHKDDLRAPDGHALDPGVKAAVEGPAKVVGVVLNAVDDSLDKTGPAIAWTADRVTHLEALLEAARISGRLLVLTSDHGHVVERDSELRSGTGSESGRWRPSGKPAGDGEILVSGRRVLLGGGRVVLPWREDIRYGYKRAGYHGGVSGAEVAVPFAVFSATPVDEIAGWRPAPAQEPAWWHSAVATAGPAGEPPTGAARAKAAARGGAKTAARSKAPEAQGELIAIEEVTAPAAPAAPGWERFLDDLLGSEPYAAQKARAGRAAPDDARVRAVLGALLAGGCRLHESTLSAAAEVPAARLRNVLAAVRRVLSVDGYDPISYDPDEVTVELDAVLLADQFGVARP